jgi:hypothetical protein
MGGGALTFKRRGGQAGALVFNESGPNWLIVDGELRAQGEFSLALMHALEVGAAQGVCAGLELLGADAHLFEVDGAQPCGDFAGALAYDLNVPSGPRACLAAPLRQGGTVRGGLGAILERPAAALAVLRGPLAAADLVGARVAGALAAMPALQGRLLGALRGEAVASQSLDARFELSMARLFGGLAGGLAVVPSVSGVVEGLLFSPPARRSFAAARLDAGADVASSLAGWLGVGLIFRRALHVRIAAGRLPAPGVYIPPAPPVPPAPAPKLGRLAFWPHPAAPGRLTFRRWSDFVIVVPLRRVYVTMSSFALYRLSDGLGLPAVSASVKTDYRAWAWSLNASLAHELAAEQVAATADGPVNVRCEINGEAWDFLVEDPEAAEGDDTSGAVNGVSLSAYLDAPHARPGVWGNAEARAAAQIAGDVLPDGVDISTSFEDWLVPAGVWSLQGSPVAALKRIAEASGCVLSSSKTGLGFSLDPIYPEGLLPWQWAEATPYAVVPRGYFYSRGRRWATKPAYNLVIVSGEAAGVRGRVKRAGSAGDWEAPQIVDPLVCAVAAARQRGRPVLGDGGRQSVDTVAMPLGPDLGLVPLGALLEVQDLRETWRGMVRSVRVSIKMAGEAADVEQVLEIERHYL